MIHFAKNIKYLREKENYKQEEMLDLVGVKRSTWSGYENGTSKPNLEDFIRIAEFFDISETDLLHNPDIESSYEAFPKTNGKTISEDVKALRKLLKSKDETIESLKEMIETQKDLIKGYKTRLKEK